VSAAEILASVGRSAPAQAIAKSDHLVGAALQIGHVLGFVLLLASLVLVSLRQLGWVLPQASLRTVLIGPLRLLWAGLALAALTGVLMFIASPALYFFKPVFLFKLGLLVLAVLLQGTVSFLALRADSDGVSGRVKLLVLLSVLAWFGVGAAGRIIGFV